MVGIDVFVPPPFCLTLDDPRLNQLSQSAAMCNYQPDTWRDLRGHAVQTKGNEIDRCDIFENRFGGSQ